MLFRSREHMTNDESILYSQHRIRVIAESTSPVPIKCQVMPMYGPEQWFDVEWETLASPLPQKDE